MKFLLNILLLAFAASTVAHAQLPARSARSAGFAELRAEYARALERIDSAEEKKLDELKRQYAEAIDRGVVHYMRQGDLKSTLALRDERERFEEEGTIPPEVRDSNTGVSPVATANPSNTGVSPVEQTDPAPQPVSWDDVDDGVIRTIKRCRERWQRINQTANRQRLELHEYYAEKLICRKENRT